MDNYILLNENIPGYIDSAFEFSMSGEFNTAVISFEFDAELLNDENFVPKIYYFNEETQLLEELSNQTVEGNVISVETTHFSKYILLNKTEFDKVWESDIKLPDSYSGIDVVFVMDMSWNMVSSDPKKIRSSVAKAFVDKLGENDRAAVGYFDNIGIFYQDFTSDRDLLYSAIEFAPFFGQSSDLSSGMDLAVSWFTKDSYTRTDAYKAVVLLTDGNGDYDTSYTDLAAQNGVTVYTIGLGNEVNSTVLRSIANGTGGKYYFASTANSLNGLYDNIEGEIAGSDLDSNNDGISDYYTKLLCEGKLTSGVGTNFFHGVSYDEVQSNNDYDGDGLKNGKEIIVTVAGDGKVYYRTFSNPCIDDSDGDNLLDIYDPYPFSQDNNMGVIEALSADNIEKLDEFYEINENNDSWFTEESDLKKTRDCVIILQKCLEYLGYLDMEGAAYGRMGGLTNAAILLYQINHKLYKPGADCTKIGVDKGTFYSITKSAVDRGYHIENKDLKKKLDLKFKNYRPITLVPEEFCDTTVVESERSNNIETIYTYDFSIPLERVLRYGAKEFHRHYMICDYEISNDDDMPVFLLL